MWHQAAWRSSRAEVECAVSCRYIDERRTIQADWQPLIVGPEHGAESAAFQLATRCVGHPRRECRELATRSFDDAKKRGHCHDVSVVLRALPLVGTAGFGADEGLRRPSALGCVCHIQTVALDLLVQMPPPILAQAKAMRSLDRIEHERLQLPAVAARAADSPLLAPVLRSFRRTLAAGEQNRRGVMPQMFVVVICRNRFTVPRAQE